MVKNFIEFNPKISQIFYHMAGDPVKSGISGTNDLPVNVHDLIRNDPGGEPAHEVFPDFLRIVTVVILHQFL